jgi:hypothetical protein
MKQLPKRKPISIIESLNKKRNLIKESLARPTDYVKVSDEEIVDGPYKDKDDLDEKISGKVYQLQDLPESVLKQHNIELKECKVNESTDNEDDPHTLIANALSSIDKNFEVLDEGNTWMEFKFNRKKYKLTSK